jgi:hypothetical protein
VREGKPQVEGPPQLKNTRCHVSFSRGASLFEWGEWVRCVKRLGKVGMGRIRLGVISLIFFHLLSSF